MFGLSDAHYEMLLSLIKASGVQRAIIYGSRARGDNNKYSDIDIAVSGCDYTTLERRYNFA